MTGGFHNLSPFVNHYLSIFTLGNGKLGGEEIEVYRKRLIGQLPYPVDGRRELILSLVHD